MAKFKAGQVVWVRGIIAREVADWPEVFFNNDKHSLFIESLDDVRPARRRHKLRSRDSHVGNETTISKFVRRTREMVESRPKWKRGFVKGKPTPPTEKSK